jgi:hypothetical protein
MYQIIIQLPQNRSIEGDIHLENPDGQIIAGPFRALGLSPAFLALIKGNRDRNPLRPYGNMPLGDYEIVAIYPTGSGTHFEEKQYGTRGIIVLAPVAGDGAIAQRNGREKFLIVGNLINDEENLRSTSEGVRISARAMGALVDVLTMVSPPVLVRCIERAEVAGVGTQILVETEPTPTTRSNWVKSTNSDRYYNPFADWDLEALWYLEGFECEPEFDSNESSTDWECQPSNDLNDESILETCEESPPSDESNSDFLIETPSLY